MMDTTRSHSNDEINAIFARLDRRDVEQFYASYQLWILQQHITAVQARIQSITQQIAVNQEHLQRVHPSAIALATLARLQSNGVNDIDLLDRMLERGEDWLDCTMQRLAYCEKFNFIRDNYTDWCEHALEGAYDWIDSVDENGPSPSSTQSSLVNPLSDAAVDAQAQTTEEMLLLKLMSDEDEALMQAPTLKIAALSPAKPQEDVASAAREQEQEGSTEQAPSPAMADHIPLPIPLPEEAIALESNETGIASVEQPADGVELVLADHGPTTEEVILPETNGTGQTLNTSGTSATTHQQLTPQGASPETIYQAPPGSTSPGITHPLRKRSFLRRLIAAFLGI